MIIKKYVMADLCNWTKVYCLNKIFHERYTHVVAKKRMGPLVSRLGAFLSSSSHNSVNFCSIFKNKASKSKLKLLQSN